MAASFETSSLSMASLKETLTMFAANEAQASIELPAMDLDGRNVARAIIEEMPGLACECFGFGAARALRVFKSAGAHGSTGCDASPVRVKNTFIDDWVSGDCEDDSEEASVKSMPVQFPRPSYEIKVSQAPPVLPGMLAKNSEAAASSSYEAPLSPTRKGTTKLLDLSPIGEMESKWPRDATASPGPDGSPGSASFVLPGQMSSPGTKGDRSLPSSSYMRECQVRNTFLHIDTEHLDEESDDGSAPNHRTIQSCPHDLYRQHFEAGHFVLRDPRGLPPTPQNQLQAQQRQLTPQQQQLQQQYQQQQQQQMYQQPQGQATLSTNQPPSHPEGYWGKAPSSQAAPAMPPGKLYPPAGSKSNRMGQAPATMAAAAAAAAAAATTFQTGMLVVIDGLTKLPAFNGKTGIVESHDVATGRYSVALTSPVPGCPRRAKVKAENLRPQNSTTTLLSVPPPPCYAPALDESSALAASTTLGVNPALLPDFPMTPQWGEDAVGMSHLRLTGLV